MANRSSIEFEFKGNLSQLQRDLRSATRLAQQAARETGQATQRGFEGGLAGLFRRSPERRAERAFSGLFADLATGNLAQGVASFSEKLSGLGLAAGIGVGVAVALFQKFREDIKETDKAASALRSELSKPTELFGGLGPEGLGSQLEALNKASDEFEKKSSSISYRIGKYLAGATTGALGAQREQDTERIAAIEKRQSELAGSRADAELRIANVKLQAVNSSQKDAALAKIAADADDKRSKLLLETRQKGGNTIDEFKRLSAISIEEKAAREEVKRKFDLKQREADMESYILSLKDKGLTKEQESNETIRARIQLLQSQLSRAQTEDRLPLQNKITALQQQLTPELPSRVNVSGYTLPEILKSGLEPVIDNGVQNWRWPVDKNTLGATPIGLQMPSGLEGWDYNVNTGSWIMDKMGFKKTISPESGSGMEGVGTGIDGIKKGIDDLNNKMDRYWGV